MEVEYGVGITNRFSFLPEELEDQEETPIIPVKAIRPTEAAKKGGGKTDVKVKKEPKKEKELPPSTIRVVKKESSQKVNIQKDEMKKESREKSGEIRETSSFRPGPRNQNQFPKGDGQLPRRNFKPRGAPRDRGNVGGNENTGNSEAVDAGADENGIIEQDTSKKEDGRNADEVCDDQEKENEEDGEKTPEKTLTLNEWKALQAPREKPVFNIRRPGEGEDSSRLGKLVPKKKQDDDEIARQEEDEYEIDDVYYPQRAGKFKQVADVGFTTGYQKRRGGRAGGRGRFGGGDGRDTSSEENILAERGRGLGRSRGSRGVPRRGSPPIPRINDAMDFPSLG